MNIIDIIQLKKQGKELTQQQINFWIDGLINGSIADYQSSALLMAINIMGISDKEAYYLTVAMKNSGDCLDMSAYGNLSCDKHSSGGVGDTTSFIVLPILACNGLKCGKMSGRGLGFTGGTLDKMQSIEGVKIDISQNQFYNQLEHLGLVLAGQTANLCPADKKLYALRDVTATVDSIGLIAASIMSKKLASGAKNIILDVKCGRGAFMNNISDAKRLAQLMVNIGKMSDKNVSVLITDMNTPLSRFVGNRLEMAGVLKVLSNQEKGDLYDVAVALAGQLMKNCGIDNAFDKAVESITSGRALKTFINLMIAQGAEQGFEKNFTKPSNAKFVYEYIADKDCYIKDIDALAIAKIVCDLGGGRKFVEDIIDLDVGVELCKTQGQKVDNGEVIARVYYNSKMHLDMAKSVAKTLELTDNACPKSNRILEVIE